jgi:hypothetical protein
MQHKCLILFCLLSLLAGCAAPAFKLSDESARVRLMETEYVSELQRKNPTQLVCWIEGTEPGARDLYLGENHPDHTVRVGAFRVTADGRVWINSDRTLLEDQWAPIK